MNLQTEIREIRTRLSAPVRSNDTDNYITDLEIVDWIWAAELQIAQDVSDDALLDLEATDSVTTVNGTSAYSLASDFQRLLSVQLDVGAGLQYARIINPKQARLIAQSPSWRSSAMNPYAWVYAGQLNVSPTPGSEAAVGKLKVNYVGRPTQRAKHIYSYTTGAGTAITMVDSALVQADDFWNNCKVRLTTGALKNQERLVTDFTASSDTLTVATFGTDPGQSIYYEMGEVSDLGDEFSPLIVAWATYLGFIKDADMELAAAQLNEYRTAVQAINARYGAFHRQEPSQEIPR